MNMTLHEKMVKDYNTHSFTHLYLFGFIYKGTVYMSRKNSDILSYVTTLGTGSKARYGGQKVLRFQPNNQQRLLLMQGCEAICSKEYFNDLCENSKYNRGEIFEMLIHQRYGQEWKKDNVPFYKGGDIEIFGQAYQIKFERASFASEAQLLRLTEEMGYQVRYPFVTRPGAATSPC